MCKLVVTTLASLFLLLSSSLAGAQTARARIADTPIREEANLASAIIATVTEGGSVDVVDLQGAWYRVLVPNEQVKPRVGYVLAHLIEIVNTDGSSRSLPGLPMGRAGGTIAQGPPIPPTFAQLEAQLKKTTARELATGRELALKAEVDTLQAELNALQDDQSINEIRSAQIPRPMALPPQVRAPHSQIREGLWFNGGGGFGSLSCNGCDSLSGISGGLSLGVTINERILLGAGTTGYYKSIDRSVLSVGTLDARVRFYPVRASGFFLTGGLGLGHLSFNSSETQFGAGVVLGLGWDIRVGSNLSLTPFWNGIGVTTRFNDASVNQFGVGLTVH